MAKQAAKATATDLEPPPHRRDLILEAAIKLFRERGFDATGIDEIGAAAGITGPGVYRHFASKQDILDEAVRYGSTVVLQTEREILELGTTPEETVDRLVAEIVDTSLDAPATIVVLLRERRNMSPQGRRAWDRALDTYVTEWVGPLRALAPGLPEPEARMTVYVAMGMVMAAAQSDGGGLPRDVLAARLRAMLKAAVLAQP